MTKCEASKKTLEKIMRGEVKQKSRWYFFFQNLGLWVLGTVSVLAGSLLVSLIIFTIANCDAEIHREVYGNMISHTTVFLVALWILLTGGLIVLSDTSLRRTKRGYVYPLWLILAIDIILSVIFGTIFYFAGVGSYADDMLGSHTQYYQDIEKRRATLFNKPDEGILMGKVYDVGDGFVRVATANDGGWIVFTNEMENDDVLQNVQEGADIVFAGLIREGNVFVACDAKWVGIHGMHRELQKRHIELIKQTHAERKEVLLEKIKNQSLKNLCNENVRWRIQVQQ